MWEKIRVIFTIPELRHKIFLTLICLAVYRIGGLVTLPMFDSAKMKAQFNAGGTSDFGKMLDYMGQFSASSLTNITIFGLGIMPYISASIIFQLLASVYPPLEKLQKEGETGRKKINEYTRYATIVLCLGQSWFYLHSMATQSAGSLIKTAYLNDKANPMSGMTFSAQIVAVLTMTAGTAFLMWLGEQIDEYGIGNGISLLIMAGILARFPHALSEVFGPILTGQLSVGGGRGQPLGVDSLLVLVLLFFAVIAGVVFISQGQRRIPTQSAKHVRGRKQFGGGRQYLPLRVNQAGVMPIIFASSLLLFPWAFFSYLGSSKWFSGNQLIITLTDAFHRGDSFLYNVLYVVLIYFFCYFWTAISFNPKEMADNLKNFGSFIPGYRPGKRTADFLEKVMVRITYVGAGFLAIVAILPTIISSSMGGSLPPSVAAFYGGTSLLIAVSVAFDVVQKVDSHLVMRNYPGLLEG